MILRYTKDNLLPCGWFKSLNFLKPLKTDEKLLRSSKLEPRNKVYYILCNT